MTSVAILDDHALIVDTLANSLSATGKYCIFGKFTTIDSFFQSLRYSIPDILLLDFELNDTQNRRGDSVIEYIHQNYPTIRMVLLSSVTSAPEYSKIAKLSPPPSFICKDEPMDSFLRSIDEVVKKGFCHPERILQHQQAQPKVMPARERLSLESLLSQRQLAILQLSGDGLTSKEIAEKLNFSEHTINADKKSLARILKTSSTTQMVLKAYQIGVLPIELNL